MPWLVTIRGSIEAQSSGVPRGGALWAYGLNGSRTKFRTGSVAIHRNCALELEDDSKLRWDWYYSLNSFSPLQKLSTSDTYARLGNKPHRKKENTQTFFFPSLPTNHPLTASKRTSFKITLLMVFCWPRQKKKKLHLYLCVCVYIFTLRILTLHACFQFIYIILYIPCPLNFVDFITYHFL